MMSGDELFELMKRFEEVPLEDKRLVVKRNHGHLIIVKDTVKDYLFGKVNYGKGSFYEMEVENKKVRLSYSNLEKIFANNRKN